jgi:hypothetical protein
MPTFFPKGILATNGSEFKNCPSTEPEIGGFSLLPKALKSICILFFFN